MQKSVYQDSDTESASYKGIALKCLIFLIMMIIGVALAMFLHNLNYSTIYIDDDISANTAEIIGGLASSVLVLALSIVCIFLKKTIPFLAHYIA